MADGYVINDTTYAGEVASQFIVKSLTGADTIGGGHIYVKDGIKKLFTIPRWDANYEDFIQDRKPTPVTKGSFVVDARTLDPQDHMIYTEFNPRDFEDHWYATQLNQTLIDRSLPYSVESVMVQGVLSRYAKWLNKMIWNGDTTGTGIYKYFNGIITRAVADSAVPKVTSPIALTAGNIVSKFQAGYDMLDASIRYDLDLKYFVSYKTYDLYDQAQENQTNKGKDFTQRGKDSYKGIKVVKVADFPDDCFLIAKGSASNKSNLWIGLNSVADEGLQLQKLQANSELYFIKMLAKADVNYGWAEEMVLYKA